MSVLESAADPERPIAPPLFLQSFVGRRPRAQTLYHILKIIALGITVVALMLAWRFTALSALAHPDIIRQWLSDIAEIPGAPLIVLATFVVGGLLVFPVLLLIAATAAAFGPWLGFVLAGAGAIASAVVTYGVGAVIGRNAVEKYPGSATSIAYAAASFGGACSRWRRSDWFRSHHSRWSIWSPARARYRLPIMCWAPSSAWLPAWS